MKVMRSVSVGPVPRSIIEADVDWVTEIDLLPMLIRHTTRLRVETIIVSREIRVFFVRDDGHLSHVTRYTGHGAEMHVLVSLVNMFSDGIASWSLTPESLFLSCCTYVVHNAEGAHGIKRFTVYPESWTDLRHRLLALFMQGQA